MRSEYYAEDEEQREETKGEAELIIAKQRNGPVGEVKLTFLKEYTRFEDRADVPGLELLSAFRATKGKNTKSEEGKPTVFPQP